MAGHESMKGRPRRPSARQLARALVMLARSRQRLRHVPSVAQVAALARCAGEEPCSYLFDATANWLPAAAEHAVAEQRGRYGLCFMCMRPGARRAELVVLGSGRAFDLLGSERLERV